MELLGLLFVYEYRSFSRVFYMEMIIVFYQWDARAWTIMRIPRLLSAAARGWGGFDGITSVTFHNAFTLHTYKRQPL